MKHFLKNIIFFFSFAGILIATLIALDFFKVFRSYNDVYTDNFVGLNRGVVTYNLYEANKNKEKYNAFILGNSRAQAFKCKDWAKYLENDASPFHFDANSEGVYGIATKLEYLNNTGADIEYALLIIDRLLLEKTENSESHMFIGHPNVTKESAFSYYASFLRAALNPQFILAYFDYKLFKQYRPYMSNMIATSKYPYQMDSITGDLYYGQDQEIQEDSIGYYNAKIAKGIFYKRPIGEMPPLKFSLEEEKQLESIKNIFQKHKTKFKIVISPKYDQIAIDENQLAHLIRLFGKQHVYNFSGKNKWTEPLGNFYENRHFRPHVAKSLLFEIYSE